MDADNNKTNNTIDKKKNSKKQKDGGDVVANPKDFQIVGKRQLLKEERDRDVVI